MSNTNLHPIHLQREISKLFKGCAKKHNFHECFWRTLEILRNEAFYTSEDYEEKDKAFSQFWYGIGKQLDSIQNRIYNTEWENHSSEHLS